MRYAVEPLALVAILAGLILATAAGSAVFGGLTVAGGAYGLLLPQVLAPDGRAAR